MLRNIATDSARTNDLQAQLELIWIAADAVRADAAWRFSRQGRSLSVSVHGMRRPDHKPSEPAPGVGKPGVSTTADGGKYTGSSAGSPSSVRVLTDGLPGSCTSMLLQVREIGAVSPSLSS